MSTTTVTKDKDTFHYDIFAKLPNHSRPLQIKVKPRISELQDYILGETIGEGGFGFVKKASHVPTGETVAIKVCKTIGLSPDQLRVFDREIQVQRSLFHQNIAQIYEVIHTRSTIYIVMEYCHNGELFDHINRRGPLPESEAAQIFHQILSALIYLRQQKISHRDIKPENILFHKNGKVKLIDFGFSCYSSEDYFRKTVCGTPSYTAPEILKQDCYDPELVDVWCLGVTLYAMLAAQLPFEDGPKEKRKCNIVNFRYSPQPQFSFRAQKLIASIFVQAKGRPKLKDLLWSDFSLAYDRPQAQSIDLDTERVQIEKTVIEFVAQKDGDNEKIIESVQRGRFDKYRPLYYLSLQKLQRQDPNQRLNSLRKQKKHSSKKLEPLPRTPSISRKPQCSGDYKINLLEMKLGAPLTSKTSKKREKKVINCSPIDPNQSRLRKNSIDSPRRLLDCLPAYMPF